MLQSALLSAPSRPAAHGMQTSRGPVLRIAEAHQPRTKRRCCVRLARRSENIRPCATFTSQRTDFSISPVAAPSSHPYVAHTGALCTLYLSRQRASPASPATANSRKSVRIGSTRLPVACRMCLYKPQREDIISPAAIQQQWSNSRPPSSNKSTRQSSRPHSPTFAHHKTMHRVVRTKKNRH